MDLCLITAGDTSIISIMGAFSYRAGPNPLRQQLTLKGHWTDERSERTWLIYLLYTIEINEGAVERMAIGCSPINHTVLAVVILIERI